MESFICKAQINHSVQTNMDLIQILYEFDPITIYVSTNMYTHPLNLRYTILTTEWYSPLLNQKASKVFKKNFGGL